MPCISRLGNIRICMYYDEHPPPHFHARYDGRETVFSITPVAIMQGQPPRRVLAIVLPWAAAHQMELLDNWERCRNEIPPLPISS